MIISGDLFDQPRAADYALFKNFRASLQRAARSEPIIVPGNHDQKWFGNAPNRLRQVADLECRRTAFGQNRPLPDLVLAAVKPTVVIRFPKMARDVVHLLGYPS